MPQSGPDLRSVRASREPINIVGMGTIDYRSGWRIQHRLVAQRAQGRSADTLLLVEHPFVYTAGSGTRPEDLPTNDSNVIYVDRGGRITWHGPGQLVGYLVLGLAQECGGADAVRRVEDALIAVNARMGVNGHRELPTEFSVGLPR